MKIAVDASALAISGNGIGRYLRSALDRMLQISDEQHHHWVLYGRRALSCVDWPSHVQTRSDRFPPHLGRIASLGISLPMGVARDCPDVFWGPAHRLPLWLPRSVARVVTIHDLCWLKAPSTMRASTRQLDALLMPRALGAADRIVAVSSATAEELREAFPQFAAKIVVVHEAAGTLPAPGPTRDLDQLGIGQRFVLFVGTTEPRKNLQRLLQAFAAATSAHRGIQLVVAGQTGWGCEELAKQADVLDLTDRLVWLGKIDDATLATLYRHARCLALPSLYEGFGLPLLEALAHGTPVLTSNCSAMPEVAGDAGILVDPLSSDAIARGLASLLFDDTLHSSLAARAVAQAQRFSWDTAAHDTLAVFAEAIEHRRHLTPAA